MVGHNKRPPFCEKVIYKSYWQMKDSHSHDRYELYYLKKGATKYFVNDKIYLLEPGDIIFIPKNVYHKTDNMESADTERLLFMFDDNDIGEEFSPYIEWLKTKKFIRINQEKLHHIQSLLKNIENEEERKPSGYEKMQMLYFRQLLILIFRYSVEPEHKLDAAYALAETISEYISKNFHKDLSLALLSKEYSMSASYLSRFFKRTTGVGLNEYINITRITAAEKLLATTDLPITQIASHCGFNDSNYFAAVFKRLKGITPKKFAMLNRN